MARETIPSDNAPTGDIPNGELRLKRLVAQALPSYDVGGEIGRGGCGVVFDGTHRQMGRRVAIKVLLPAVATDPDMCARFFLEAKVLAKVGHPGIVAIYDYVENDGLYVLVLEYVSGRSLWSQFTDPGMTWRASCVTMIAICDALQHAHDRGILHRDLKPGNVLVSDNGVVKVIDFGIAKIIGGANSYSTRTGQLLGTPAYMAPEQIDHGEITERTDVYGAGTMFYELLCGDLPYPENTNVWDMLGRKIRETPEPLLLRDADIPAALADAAMRAIASRAGDRIPSASAFGEAIANAAKVAWGAAWADSPDAAVGTDSIPRVVPRVSGHVDGRFAVAVHEVYRAMRAVQEHGSVPSTVAWADLPDALKASSQAFADVTAQVPSLGGRPSTTFRAISCRTVSWPEGILVRGWRRRSPRFGPRTRSCATSFLS